MIISCKNQIKVFPNKPPLIVNLTIMIATNFTIIIIIVISIILSLPNNNKLIRRIIIIMKLNILYMKLLIKGCQKDKLKTRLFYFQARIIC